MKQKIFARHFYPVLRIKFFNPEKLVSLRRRRRFVQIRNFKKKKKSAATTKQSPCTGNKIKTVVLCLSPSIPCHPGRSKRRLQFIKGCRFFFRGEVVQSETMMEHLNHIMQNIVIAQTNVDAKAKRRQWHSRRSFENQFKLSTARCVNEEKFRVNYEALRNLQTT